MKNLTTKEILKLGLSGVKSRAKHQANELFTQVNTEGMSDAKKKKEWEKLFIKEQKKLMQPLFSTANKRIKTLKSNMEKGKIREPSSLVALSYSGISKFSTATNVQKELNRQFSAAEQFMTSRSSTVKGAIEVEKTAVRNEQFANLVGKDDANAFWKAYNRFQELHPGELGSWGSAIVQGQVQEEITSAEPFSDLDLAGYDDEEKVDIILEYMEQKFAPITNPQKTPEPEEWEDVFDAGESGFWV